MLRENIPTKLKQNQRDHTRHGNSLRLFSRSWSLRLEVAARCKGEAGLPGCCGVTAWGPQNRME